MLKKRGLMVTIFTLVAVNGARASDVDKSSVVKQMSERGVVNMGYRESSVPFSYIGTDGKPQGYSVDLCRKVIDRIEAVTGKSDLKIKYVAVTSQTRIALTANGTIDIECGSTTKNLTRQKQVEYLSVTFVIGTTNKHDNFACKGFRILVCGLANFQFTNGFNLQSVGFGSSSRTSLSIQLQRQSVWSRGLYV